jgi:nucleotide-binding universal stress UspA family protein
VGRRRRDRRRRVGTSDASAPLDARDSTREDDARETTEETERKMKTNSTTLEPAREARAKKRILLLLSGAQEQDVKMVEYARAYAFEPNDDVWCVHYSRGATRYASAMYGPGRIAGSYKADEDSVTERMGARVAPLRRDDVEDAGAESERESSWLPEYVRAELLDRRLSGKSFVQVVEISGSSGKFSVEEAVQAIVDGEFASAENDNWVCIPKPDLIVMGCRGHGLVRRALLGSVTQNVLNRIPVSTLFFRSSLPKIVGASDLVKQKLGGVDQRVVCICMSGSNSSRRLCEYFVKEHLRPTDVVLLLHCLAESQRKQKDLSEADVEENLSRSYDLVQNFQKEHPGHGRVIRMVLQKETGSASDIRDRTIDFLNMTDVNLAVVGRAVSSGHLRSRFMSPYPQYCVTHAPCPVLVWNPPPAYIRSQSQTSAAEKSTVAA